MNKVSHEQTETMENESAHEEQEVEINELDEWFGDIQEQLSGLSVKPPF